MLDTRLKNQAVKIRIITEGCQIVIVLRANPQRGLQIKSAL